MYKVLSTFKEIQHDNHIYKEGKTYPANGFDVDPKRVEFLQSTHPDYRVKFLGEEIEESQKVTPKRTQRKKPGEE